MLIGGLGDRRLRALLALGFIVVAAVLAGHGIYTGHRRFLAVVALFTLVVLFRRAAFPDFYLLTLACAVLSHVQIGVIREEFDKDKWLALFVMGGVALFTAALRIDKPQWPRLIHLLVLAEVVLASYSVSWSSHPWLTFQKSGVYSVGMLIAFVGAWSYAVDLDGVRRVVDTHVDWLWLVFPLSMVVLVMPYGGKFQVGRFYSVFQNANNLGFWASLSLPLLFGLALTHPVTWRRRVALLMLVSGAICVFLAGSRGGTLGSIAGIGFYCLLRWPRRTLSVAAVAAIIVCFVVAYEVDLTWLSPHVEHLLRTDTIATLSDRRVSWEMAKVMISNRPWWGHGFGLSDQIFVDYGVESFPGAAPPSLASTYLETLCSIGWVGMGLLVAIQGAAVWAGLRTWWSDRKGQYGLLSLALVATVISSSAHGVVEDIFFSMGNPWSLPYWVNLALLAKLGALASQKSRAPARQTAVVRVPAAVPATP